MINMKEENQVYKYQCCNKVEFTTTVKNRICNLCKQRIEPNIIKYSNTFNIKSFIKEEYPEWNLSPTAISQFYDLIKTLTMIQTERCIKEFNNRGKNEKTIMAKNFDWRMLDQLNQVE